MANRYFFIHPGRLLKIDQPEFQARLITGLGDIEAVTQARFIRSAKPRGIQFFTVGFDQMLKLYGSKNGKAPLGLRKGNRVYYLNDRDRFGNPVDYIVEGLTVHEVGHVLGLKHSTDLTSIMHPWLPVMRMNPTDVLNFQKRAGKPK